ncbi:thiamine-monophosphate kinase [Natrialba magadii ATCC 43099]|uniref:Thiamine-monophosphate kinase n=1 Tax=Natrialba magadii (strain ATCC 43099 / DSM 3394 / CCM 3739 / CIP 104546 / IAM 13178 / JCM 8861 / NBRC 102185 / NCIMB 2190 / MS3) TaxID=547559 RepID=D3STS4_NATMM|nr:thiamine-phosphate kinase [Natrialba magadii]ADD05091.1 thiamine-monophosphate kinase [Natrialba magadii ATCC 43099]ELY23326.1 thiamine-monophosphate kinase [Natrialba magadii ATCC 43099]
MDERAALALLADELEYAGDDAAVVDDLVVTTDMLHETTDFPAGTTRYTAGWRAVGASLSDVAAMGAEAVAAVAAYAAPEFDGEELLAFVRGARDVCDLVGADYVGGDLDGHDEFTVTTTAIGRFDGQPVPRSGANSGNLLCVTGTLGRSAAALEYFGQNKHERANELFQFEPRIEAGRALALHATAMMDSSDGLARSLHQLGEASGCGFEVDASRVPIAESLREVTDTDEEALEQATTFGEDFELVATIPEGALAGVREVTPVSISVLGSAVPREDGITMDGEALPDRGFTHGCD